MSSTSPTTWEDYVIALGLNLQRRRAGSGLTQEALAHRAGVTRNLYQMLEHGTWGNGAAANPSLKVLVRLAMELQVGVDELLPPMNALERFDS